MRSGMKEREKEIERLGRRWRSRRKKKKKKEREKIKVNFFCFLGVWLRQRKGLVVEEDASL